MDTWKFFDITHREHEVCNPMSLAKISHLTYLLRLEPGTPVLEIAMGKGEFIVQLAEKYGERGTALDLSPYCVADARKKLQERVPGASIAFLEMDGADYQPVTPESFALAACIGASWIFDGHQGTLEALLSMVAGGGIIVVGEPDWRREPDADYLEAAGWTRDSFGTHEENVRVGEELGLILEYALVSNQDDWDRYEGLQWYAAERYAREHADDPDVPELLERVRHDKEVYLKWGRETLGWAIYVFRKPS